MGGEDVSRHLIQGTFLVVVLAAAAGPVLSEESKLRLEPVQRDVQELSEAMYRGDLDTILGFTHPKIIKMLGGREAVRSVIEQGLKPILASGMTLEAFSFPSPPKYVEGKERRFAIIPTLSIMAVKGQRIESLNYQFGVLEPGAAGWTYLEGSRINQENVRAFFPDFPADYSFPDFYRKPL